MTSTLFIKTMHVRIELEQFEHLLQSVHTSIERNIDYANRHEFPEASGYARGGLMGIELVLKTLRETSTHEDTWDILTEPTD